MSNIVVALISRGLAEENRKKFGVVKLGLQEDREVYDAYGIHRTSSGVLMLHPDGGLLSPYTSGHGNLRKLMARTIRDLRGECSARQPLKMSKFGEADDPKQLLHILEDPNVGTKVTRLPLPELNGGYVGLDDLRGTRTVLPFWGPDGAFCQRMLPVLKAWEEQADSSQVYLLIISSGTVEENHDLGPRSRIVPDDAFTTVWDDGVMGTPSVLLPDEEGQVASTLVM